jgi:hypothetical protein
MILIPLQLVLLALITAYMVYFATEQYRRNHRSWHAIVNRLSFAWNGASLNLGVAVSPWTAFRNAGVMMEMADYLEGHAQEFETASLETLRCTAIHLRFESLLALARRSPLR